MKKELRKKVYAKYGGRCAYCGKAINYVDMQVDHYLPHRQGMIPKEISDKVENLMPACRRCNHYKRAWPPEEFRKLIKKLEKKIRETYLAKVALDFGIIKFKPFDGIFFFEKYNQNKNNKNTLFKKYIY